MNFINLQNCLMVSIMITKLRIQLTYNSSAYLKAMIAKSMLKILLRGTYVESRTKSRKLREEKRSYYQQGSLRSKSVKCTSTGRQRDKEKLMELTDFKSSI